MGIGITQEQRELAEAVRGWAGRAVPPEARRKLLDEPPEPGARPAYWESLAVQGLLAPHLPEADGGGGGGLLDLAVVLEETGRAGLPGPYLPSVLAAEALHRAGFGTLVRALAGGELIGAVALGTGSLTATPTADGDWVLDGTAPPVLGGAQADILLLAARTGPGDGSGPGSGPGSGSGSGSRSDSGGTVRLAVDADALAVRAQAGADPLRPTAEVTARDVTVPAARLLFHGEEAAHPDPDPVPDLARLLLSAEACGVAAWAVETAAEHARNREQFGRPIGQFQGIKHLCADMLVRLEQARALTWDAARAAAEETAAPSGAHDNGDAARVRALAVALAASTAPEAAYECAKDCVQILGGIGFTWEHDAHLYLRRALVARQLIGTASTHHLRAVRLAAAGARRELRMELPASAEPYRERARTVLEPVKGLDPASVRRKLAPTGYAAPHLPEPYGLGAGPVRQLAVQQELADAGVRVSDLGIGTWVVPSLISYGTEAQRERHLPPTLRGDVLWCQLFSEPGAGSDLASLRTRAERAEDGSWRVTGQKVWTSAAQWADWGILLARTDPGAPKHKGLTYFLVDMKNTPGIDIRPLKEMTGDSLFNEVWFDGAPLPADAVVGEVDDGWRVARHTLGNERVHMADQLTFGTGLEALIRRTVAPVVDDTVRARVGALAAEAHALACVGMRTTLAQVSGLEPGAGASVRKLVQTPHQQKVVELALELLGPEGALAEGAGERAVHGVLMSRCLTIAGGTTQIQRNVVAERLLGLPRDPEPGS
ncbi:acyl-CoA dehydrogenase [Streptomyces sp. NPDC054796]